LGALANMAGVHDHHVRAFGLVHGGIAERGQQVRHPCTVVHVHLTAMRYDMQFTGFAVRGIHTPTTRSLKIASDSDTSFSANWADIPNMQGICAAHPPFVRSIPAG